MSENLSRPMLLRLLENEAPTDTTFRLNKSITTIGRDETCDMCLPDAKMSRLHCEVILEAGYYILVDRHSTNGTFANGSRIVHHMLEIGDLIQFGNKEFRVELVPINAGEIKWRDKDSSEVSYSIPVERMRRKIQIISERDMAGEQKEATEGNAEQPVKIFDVALDARSAAAVRADSEMDESARQEVREDPQKAFEQLRLLYKVADRINQITTVEELCDLICETVFNLLENAEYLHFSVRENPDAETGRFRPLRAISRMYGHTESGIEISRTLFNQALESKSGVLCTDPEHDKRFDESASIIRLHIRSAMCVPFISAGKPIAVLYVDNRTTPNVFSEDQLELFTALGSQFAVALDKILMFSSLQKSYYETMLALVNTLEAKDRYTTGHTQRVCQYALGIARELNMPAEECSKIQTAAMLHDIGKIGISQQILSKTSTLSSTEYTKVKNHVELGCQILKPITYLKDIIPIIRGHHERYDGKGYPDGLAGEDIPLGARILGLADALDAMTSQRPYNKMLSKTEALQCCQECAGTQFDPLVVEALESYVRKYDIISPEATFVSNIPKDPEKQRLLLQGAPLGNDSKTLPENEFDDV